MLLFIDHVAAKQIIAPALNSIAGGPAKLFEGSRGQVLGAIETLVRHAVARGEMRKDIEPSDLLRALIGVAHMTSDPGWQESGRRLDLWPRSSHEYADVRPVALPRYLGHRWLL